MALSNEVSHEKYNPNAGTLQLLEPRYSSNRGSPTRIPETILQTLEAPKKGDNLVRDSFQVTIRGIRGDGTVLALVAGYDCDILNRVGCFVEGPKERIFSLFYGQDGVECTRIADNLNEPKILDYLLPCRIEEANVVRWETGEATLDQLRQKGCILRPKVGASRSSPIEDWPNGNFIGLTDLERQQLVNSILFRWVGRNLSMSEQEVELRRQILSNPYPPRGFTDSQLLGLHLGVPGTDNFDS